MTLWVWAIGSTDAIIARIAGPRQRPQNVLSRRRARCAGMSGARIDGRSFDPAIDFAFPVKVR
jgi:hypothetical protein